MFISRPTDGKYKNFPVLASTCQIGDHSSLIYNILVLKSRLNQQKTCLHKQNVYCILDSNEQNVPCTLNLKAILCAQFVDRILFVKKEKITALDLEFPKLSKKPRFINRIVSAWQRAAGSLLATFHCGREKPGLPTENTRRWRWVTVAHHRLVPGHYNSPCRPQSESCPWWNRCAGLEWERRP